MNLMIRSVCLSAHLDSFCTRINAMLGGGLKFVYETDDPGAMRRQVGWSIDASYKHELDSDSVREESKSVDLLIDMLREINLFETRCKANLPTYYWCERWFKPIHGLPGWIRLFVPSYWKMARRFAKLMDNENFYLLPCGVHAVRDFVRIHDFFHGRWWRVWREPKNAIERVLGGRVEGFPRMKLWAYFVAPSSTKATEDKPSDGTLKVLWAGRMIRLKRVDVLIKAIRRVVESGRRKVKLTLVGEGPERTRLEKLAGGVDYITFNSYVKNDELRKMMHKYDVYVMPSNGEEGWGAAVSEALAEGCNVISTYEAGSSATLLDEDSLYTANRVSDLVTKLIEFQRKKVAFDPSQWSGENGAKKFMEFAT